MNDVSIGQKVTSSNIPPADKPDPKAAQALQEGLGGQFGGRNADHDAILFSKYEFRGDAKPYQDL